MEARQAAPQSVISCCLTHACLGICIIALVSILYYLDESVKVFLVDSEIIWWITLSIQMWCLFLQSSILTHNIIIPHGMTKNHMRLLTEQELQSIYGGNVLNSIWNWLKRHLFLRTTDDPNKRLELGVVLWELAQGAAVQLVKCTAALLFQYNTYKIFCL